MTHRAAVMLAVALFASCGSPKIVKTLCREDSDCEGGLLCEDFRCIEQKTKACEVVTDGNPILQPSPYTVAFGDLDVAEAMQTIELHSIGNCTLTLFEANLTRDAGSPFTCDFCSGKFPVEIFPNRNAPVQISFKAKQVGQADDELRILSDDKEFPELRVPLHANFLGVPSLKATPNPVDFGYVAMGRQQTRKVQMSNQGTGVAEIQITSIALSPIDTMDFDLKLGDLMVPLSLKPLAIDSKGLISVEINYHPRSNAIHNISLVITTNKGDMVVPITGNSETPPVLDICAGASATGMARCLSEMGTPTVNLGDVPYGATNVLPITILNKGGAPLKVTYKWGGTPNTDFSAVPAVVPAILRGTYTELNVAFNAATVTCNVNGCVAKPATALLVIESNDPMRPSVTIPISAKALPAAGPEVLKVEMIFDNGVDGTFTDDLRNVDMRLEHPYGFVCDKAHPSPTTWGNFGSPTWLAFPPKEEPERIVLTGAMVDATYRVQLGYMEDCKSIPTDLLAGLLGISVDVLVDYLSGGIIPLDPTMVSNLISSICFDHAASNVTVRAFVNGNMIKEKTVGIGRKGDSTYAMDIVRDGGSFEAH